MSTTSVTRSYALSEFTSLGGQSINLPLLIAAFDAAAFVEPVANISPRSGGGVVVTWDNAPAAADYTLADSLVAAHTGTVTSSAVQQFEALGNVDATSSTFVDIFNELSLPLNAGTYLVVGATELFMPTVVANTFIQAEFRLGFGAGIGTRIGGTTFVSTPITHYGGYDPHAFITVTAGQQLRMILRLCKLGVAAATARAANSRMSFGTVA